MAAADSGQDIAKRHHGLRNQARLMGLPCEWEHCQAPTRIVPAFFHRIVQA
jgi:hypothetical protein